MSIDTSTQMVASRNAQAVSLAVPGNNLDAYIASVNTVPVLTPEEEKSLAERLFHDEDLEAARQLVFSHLRFVVHIARSYSGYGLPLADLIQEGNVGLMKAVRRFDPSHNVRLVSFAVHWIKAEIHEFVIKNWRIVKVATTKAQRKLFFNLRSSKKRLGRLTLAEADAVAKDLGVTRDQVIEMEGRLGAHDATFDAPVDASDDDNMVWSPSLYLEAPEADPADALEAANTEENDMRRLSDALATLDERSRDILQARWLTDKKQTLHELADKYQVSAERIRQLENNAIKKLRGAMMD